MKLERPERGHSTESDTQERLMRLKTKEARLREEILSGSNRDPDFIMSRIEERMNVDNLVGLLERPGATAAKVLEGLKLDLGVIEHILEKGLSAKEEERAKRAKRSLEDQIEILSLI